MFFEEWTSAHTFNGNYRGQMSSLLLKSCKWNTFVTIKYVNHSTYLAIGLYQGPTTARVDFVAAIWTEFDPENNKNTINIGLNEVCIWYCDLKKKLTSSFKLKTEKEVSADSW